MNGLGSVEGRRDGCWGVNGAAYMAVAWSVGLVLVLSTKCSQNVGYCHLVILLVKKSVSMSVCVRVYMSC